MHAAEVMFFFLKPLGPDCRLDNNKNVRTMTATYRFCPWDLFRLFAKEEVFPIAEYFVDPLAVENSNLGTVLPNLLSQCQSTCNAKQTK